MTNMNLYSRGDKLFVIINMVLIMGFLALVAKEVKTPEEQREAEAALAEAEAELV